MGGADGLPRSAGEYVRSVETIPFCCTNAVEGVRRTLSPKKVSLGMRVTCVPFLGSDDYKRPSRPMGKAEYPFVPDGVAR